MTSSLRALVERKLHESARHTSRKDFEARPSAAKTPLHASFDLVLQKARDVVDSPAVLASSDPSEQLLALMFIVMAELRNEMADAVAKCLLGLRDLTDRTPVIPDE